MNTELNELEGKVAALIALCQQLRQENRQLGRQLADVRQDNARLNDKVNVAAQRLEALLQTLPESST